jgi:hypothetical protein
MLSKKDAKVTFLAIYLPTPSPEPLHLSYILFSWGKKTPSYASHVSCGTLIPRLRLFVSSCFHLLSSFTLFSQLFFLWKSDFLSCERLQSARARLFLLSSCHLTLPTT